MAAYYADSTILSHATSLQPYGRFSDPDDPDQSSGIYNLPTDSEGDAEIDELESDTEEDQVASTSSAGEKKGGRKLGERIPGTSLLPAPRIESMIHADGTTVSSTTYLAVFISQGITGSLTMSKEAIFMISVATVSPRARLILG